MEGVVNVEWHGQDYLHLKWHVVCFGLAPLVEVNSEKAKYMITSCQQNIVQTQNILIENLSFNNVEKFKYLGVTVQIQTTSAKKLNAE